MVRYLLLSILLFTVLSACSSKEADMEMTSTPANEDAGSVSDNVYWVLEVAIKAGEFDNFKELMGEMVEATQANEANTLNYQWAISEDGQSCHIYERYANSAAAMTHLGAFGEKFAERFMATVEPTRFVVYGNPNSEVKEALSGFGAAFMAPFGGFARQ